MQATVKYLVVEQEIKFPCLMESNSDEYIVLFQSENTGVIVASAYKDAIGQSCHRSLNTYDFKPFNGSITLSN